MSALTNQQAARMILLSLRPRHKRSPAENAEYDRLQKSLLNGVRARLRTPPTDTEGTT